MQYPEQMRYFVEFTMRQLKGFVPRGGAVEFEVHIELAGNDTLRFVVPQPYGAEDQLQPETELWTP